MEEDKKPDVELLIQDDEKKNPENIWRSLCFVIHPDATRFFAKLLISLIVIWLCAYQLINVADCGSQHMYSGLLGIILGAYLK
jgi:hypothetical protein